MFVIAGSSFQWHPAITKCHGTEKDVRYSGVFVTVAPRYNEVSRYRKNNVRYVHYNEIIWLITKIFVTAG